MLEFRQLKLEDKIKFDQLLQGHNYYLCDLCFVDIFIWGQYSSQIAFTEDFVFLKINMDNETVFLPPLGKGLLSDGVAMLKEYADAIGQTLTMVAVPLDIKNNLEAVYKDSIEITENRNKYNYIYTAQSLMTLKGKKLHSKRNHINKFLSVYGDSWSYEELNDENTGEFFSYHLDWCEINEGNFLGETCAISAALKNRKALGLKGGVLRLQGKIVAVTMGSEFGDSFIVHFEKADGSIQGVYQMINQQFAIHTFENIKYVNREEDLGIEGLRKAKLSYYPEFLAESYTCRLVK